MGLFFDLGLTNVVLGEELIWLVKNPATSAAVLFVCWQLASTLEMFVELNGKFKFTNKGIFSVFRMFFRTY